MKIIFLGCTKFSEELLQDILLNTSVEIAAIFTIPQDFHISYSKTKVHNTNFSDLKPYAVLHNIPIYEVDSIRGKRITDYKILLQEIKPDVILVLGWYYMVPKSIRDLAKLGAWGIHASLLPRYAGGAPLVWAMINGEKESGVTLFRLDDGVDDGDILAQISIPILDIDTIKEVYDRATEASKKILQAVLTKPNEIIFTPQDKKLIEVFPQRKPDDGQINLNMNGEQMYNFIRAQSNPYPGAFIRTIDGKKIFIEKARLEV